MLNHTPGPWTATLDGGRLEVTGSNDADVVGGCGCCGSPWTDPHCAEGNARLIAAAPEMLRLLRAVIDEYDTGRRRCLGEIQDMVARLGFLDKATKS